MNDGVQLATGGDQSKRRDLDFYPTPSEVTVALMEFLQHNVWGSEPKNIWEPACGTGEMSEVMKQYGHRVLSTDIRDTGYGNEQGWFKGGYDFVNGPVDVPRLHAVITNPPFVLSEEFVRKALTHAPVVAMVLKSQYWHASKRTALFNEHPPAYVLALNWRPDFKEQENLATKGRKGSPTMEVHWTVWVQGQTDTRYRILEKPKVVQK